MKKFVFLSLVVIAAAGCEQHTMSDVVAFSKTVSHVDIQLDSSEVSVRASEDDSSSVDYDVTYRTSRPTVTAEVEDGVLRLRMKCRRSCDGDFIVSVPKGVSSSISLDSGNMEVKDLSGNADLRVDSGNIHVKGLSGKLSVDADSGNISGSLSSTVVDGSVDSGNVDLHFDEIPSDLDFSADSGNLRLEVPEGAYDIRTQVDSGQKRIDSVVIDGDADAKIRAAVDSGNIMIQGY